MSGSVSLARQTSGQTPSKPVSYSTAQTPRSSDPDSADLVADGPGAIESMMHTYGYTPEAVDKELHQQRSSLEALERSSSEWGGFRLFFMKVSSSFSFQAFFGTLIVLNAVTMGFEADSSSDMEDVYRTLENVFCTLFLFEVIVRVAGSAVRPWEDLALMADVVIVLIGVIDNWILAAAGISKGAGNDEAKMDLSVLTVLRILRIVRVARIFRAIAIFRPIRVLLSSLAKAAQNLFWITLLLLVMFYCFGLTFRMMLGDIDNDSHIRPVVNKHFASVGECIMTGIEVLLRGFDWTDQITTPLINHSESLAAGVVWLVFVSSVHVCVANLIVGVFVEQLLTTARESDDQVNREHLVTKAVNVGELKRVFAEMDLRGAGYITRAEFKTGIRNNPELAKTIGISIHDADVLLESVDLFGQTEIRIDDLLFAVIKLKGGTKSVDMMCFDYQIKQIIKQVQRSPTQIEELSRQLAKFELRLDSLSNEMEATKTSCIQALETVPKRLEKLEEQMASFLTSVQVSTPNSARPVGNTGSGMSLANLRESYHLADEMRELRRIMEQATAGSSLRPLQGALAGSAHHGPPGAAGQVSHLSQASM